MLSFCYPLQKKVAIIFFLVRNSCVFMRNSWVFMRNSWVPMKAHEDFEILMSSFHEEFCSWLFSDCSWVLRNAHKSWRIAHVLVSWVFHSSQKSHDHVRRTLKSALSRFPWRRPTSAGKTWTRYGLGSWPTSLVAIFFIVLNFALLSLYFVSLCSVCACALWAAVEPQPVLHTSVCLRSVGVIDAEVPGLVHALAEANF